MKNFNKLIITISLLSILYSCDDFLDKGPLTEFTDENYWTNESNVRTFAWQFYNEFLGYGNASGITAEFYFQSASGSASINISDDLCNRDYLAFQANPSSSNTDWNSLYQSVRRANLMLARIPTVKSLNQETQLHWESIARFFRAFAYYRLVQRFGDVPYIDSYTSANDYNKIYQPRMLRSQVMDKVFDDLDFAVNNMRLYDGVNTVNKNVAYALQSRVCLYEGTYRKYHNLPNGEKFLNASKAASLELINNPNYALSADYKSIYNSISLSSNKEIILYKDYQPSILMHSIQAYTNTSTIINGLSRAAVENYACEDGLPISQSGLYQGDESIESVLANRDNRLSAVIANKLAYPGKEDSGLAASTGYRFILFNNPSLSGSQVTTINQNHIDAPIFWLAEIYLNYAEACAELNNISQNDLDISINKLRNRAGINPLTYISNDVIQVNNVTIEDPERISSLEQISGVVPSIIWEIRRERRSELMSWTYMRLYDLMRWKKGEYLDMNLNPKVGQGAKVGEANKGKTTVNSDGYILPYAANKRTFTSPKNYLNSIPTGEILLYGAKGVQLTQNPGWQ